MAIRHLVSVQVAPGKASEFGDAFRVLQAAAMQEPGCEQYELFQSVDAPDRMVILERWTDQALLEQHMAGERTRNADAVEAIVGLWAPGTTPTIERFET